MVLLTSPFAHLGTNHSLSLGPEARFNILRHSLLPLGLIAIIVRFPIRLQPIRSTPIDEIDELLGLSIWSSISIIVVPNLALTKTASPTYGRATQQWLPRSPRPPQASSAPSVGSLNTLLHNRTLSAAAPAWPAHAAGHTFSI